jgi:iduronate 2-sulfatase
MNHIRTLASRCFFAMVLTSSLVADAAGNRLNVLLIAVDDMRVELGCFGSTTVRSPNIDALAERSLVFERAYCQQAVCNPSRASLLTGLSIDTLGFCDLRTHFRDTRPDLVTLPQLFKQSGYQVHGIGKIFHNFRQDKWKGDAASWSSPQRFHYGNHNTDFADVEGERPPDQIPMARAEKLEVPDEAYLDGKIARAAVGKLRELKDIPFFLGVGFWKPHLPFNAPAKYWDLYNSAEVRPPLNPQAPKNVPAIALHDGRELMRNFKQGLTPEQVLTLRRGYYAAISYVDAQIGKVLDELDRLGLRENTIVVLWSDHGFHLGEHDLWCKNSNFELDARVPLIISVPGQMTAGRRTRSLAELLDIYPTLADYCGLIPPHELEGVSLRPVLDDADATVRDFALTQNPRPFYRDAGVDPDVMGYSVRTDSFRYTQWRDFRTGKTIAAELYDHRNDPLETVNVVGRKDFTAIVTEHANRIGRGK